MTLKSINECYKTSCKRGIIISLSIALIFTLLYPQQLMIFVSPLIRAVEKQILLFRIRDYKEFRTESFIIKYNNIDAEMLEMIADTAEDKLEALTEIFCYRPENKVILVIHKDASRMMSVTMLSKGTPPMGVYYADSIHVLDPEQLFKDNLEESFYSEGPVLHELTHLFIDNIAGGNYPTWFTEGVSLYFEYAVDGYEWGEGVIIDDEAYNISSLSDDFFRLDQYLAYAQSFRLVKGFVDRYGEDELIRLIYNLGEGKDFSSYQHLFEMTSQ